MEGLRLKYLLLLTLLIFSNFSQAKMKLIGIKYFNKMYGHVHENPSKTSSSLTTIPCGYPLQVYSKKDLSKNSEWKFVKAGEDFGYVNMTHLSSKRPRCIQGKYPKFFSNFDLDLSELYYWGKLYDQFLVEKSHAN